MSDLIKREDAIKALYKYSFVSKDVIEREINAIPSADRPSIDEQAEAVLNKLYDAVNGINALVDRPSGEWIIRQPKPFFLCTCSACGETEEFMTKYCPNCGARMKGADDEDNH